MEKDERWIDPYQGFEYTSDTVVVEADYQVEKLQACGLDPALYGASVDPSFFIGFAIRAGVVSGISAEGNVNMLQSLIQHRPALLGEGLTVFGKITAVTDVPRGRTIDTDVWFEDATGARVITARRRSLKPDPTRAARGAGSRPPPVLEDLPGARVLNRYGLNPDRVTAYSEEGNSIHYDPEAARRAGFRAPLIGGGMGVHYMLAALMEAKSPSRLDLDIYFRRPIFWDDEFSVVIDAAGTGIGLARLDGDVLKVLTEARINDLA